MCLRVEVVLDIGMSEWAWDEVSDYGIACACVCVYTFIVYRFKFICLHVHVCTLACMCACDCVCVCARTCAHVEVVLDIGMSEWA